VTSVQRGADVGRRVGPEWCLKWKSLMWGRACAAQKHQSGFSDFPPIMTEAGALNVLSAFSTCTKTLPFLHRQLSCPYIICRLQSKLTSTSKGNIRTSLSQAGRAKLNDGCCRLENGCQVVGFSA